MRVSPLFLAATLLACGSPKSVPDGGTSPFSFPGYDASYSAGPFTVQPGTEIVMCTFVKGQNDQDVDVSNFALQQSLGGHHLIVYTVDHSIDLPPTPCSQGGQPSWVQVMGTQDAQQQVDLPSGVGFHIKANQQFVMETHYINATAQALTVQSAFALKYAPAGSVTQQARAYFIGSLDIDVPPNASWSTTATCSPPQAMTLYSVQGHEHRYGTGVTASLLPAGAGDGGWQQLYTTTQWDSPPIEVVDGGLTVGPSDQIKVTCDWNNTSGASLSYPQEMCYAVGMYWPAQGTLFCATGGGSDQCQCGTLGPLDAGPGGSAVQVAVSLQSGVTSLGAPPTSGHPVYCTLYQASDWPPDAIQPSAGASPDYLGDVEGVALTDPSVTATVSFVDVSPGNYSVFCFEDTISGGFIPGHGDPISFPLGSVTAVAGQTAQVSVALDLSM